METQDVTDKTLKRVFVGIKVTPDIARTCKILQSELSNLPVRLVIPENIHLTLLPPWNMENQALVEKKLQAICYLMKEFTLELTNMVSWPQNKSPRLIWIECLISKPLLSLKKLLYEAFEKEDIREFNPHITIGRFKKRMKCFNPLKKPLSLSMQVTSLELFEVPKQGGIYHILKQINFSRVA